MTEFSVPDFPNAHNLEKFISEIVRQSDRPAVDWATQLAPWDAIAEKGRSFWGDRWAFYQLANLASGIRSQKETSSEHPNLFDRSVSLCGRARYARLRAGVPGWWSKQLDSASDDSDKVFVTMLWMTWGSPATLLDCGAFDTFIESLSENEWSRLYYVITDAMVWTKAQPGSREVSLDVTQLPKRLSARTVSLLRLRANDKSADELYLQRLRKYKGGDLLILSSSQDGAIRFLDKDSNWNPHLQVVSRSFKAGVVAERYSYHTFRRNPRAAAVPLPTAIKIMERAELYPSYLVATAEARCKEEVATRLVPVVETARREGWFSE